MRDGIFIPHLKRLPEQSASRRDGRQTWWRGRSADAELRGALQCFGEHPAMARDAEAFAGRQDHIATIAFLGHPHSAFACADRRSDARALPAVEFAAPEDDPRFPAGSRAGGTAGGVVACPAAEIGRFHEPSLHAGGGQHRCRG